MNSRPQADKVRTDRFRRKLSRMGYVLMKSPTRDPDAITFDGFQIVTPNGTLVAGQGNLGRGFALSLDDVEQWIIREAAKARED